MLVLKEFPYIQIFWDPEIRAVILKWRGGYEGRNLREGLLTGLAEYKKKLPDAYWIGDTTDIGVIGQEDQDWIDREWFPVFLATGARLMAVVQPQSVVAKLSVKGIMNRVPGTKLTVYNCVHLEDARTWIKQQSKQV